MLANVLQYFLTSPFRAICSEGSDMSDRLHNILAMALISLGIALLLYAWSFPADALPKPSNPVHMARLCK